MFSGAGEWGLCAVVVVWVWVLTFGCRILTFGALGVGSGLGAGFGL